MGILDEDVARVREATDFVAVASEHLALRKVGRRWVGLCPFHAEKTPSFSVNAEDGVYYCFGCQAGGDVITFVREIEHLDFVEAVEKLAARVGITLRRDDNAGSRDQQRRQRVADVLDAAIAWYHQRLLSGADAAAARRYLRAERGYDGEVVRRYRLGWAPEGWDQLIRGLTARAAGSGATVSVDQLVEAGLATAGERGPVDSFRGRLLFPIFEAGGRPVGLGGRILPGGRGPKYKNTAGTAVYDKSRILYGLNWAKNDIVDRERVVVCEGYTDVIGLHAAGVGEAVATCGTALADGHIRLLTRFARRIVLAYDADGAGQAAAERVYEWERRFDVDISVAALPAGADPADVARRDPEALRQAVASARPFLGFLIDRRLARGDLASAEGRARAAAAALAVIDTHPNELVRDQYLMTVADRCRVEASQLRRLAALAPAEAAAAPGSAPRPAVAPSPATLVPAPELEALRLAVHRPAEVADRLEGALFAHPDGRDAFRALATSSTLHDAIATAPPAAGALLQRLVVEEVDAGTDDIMVRLVERAGARQLAELSADARQADDPSSLVPTISWLKLALEDLRAEDDAGEHLRRDAEARLVPWIVARVEGQVEGAAR